MTNEKQITNRIIVVASFMLIFAIGVGYKLFEIQVVEGEKYRDLSEKRIFKNFEIPANRGNLYDSNGHLLATSVPEYDIRFDAVTVSEENFNKNLRPLAKALGKLFNRPASHYINKLKEARNTKNRYYLVARGVSYTQYVQLREFPMVNLGAFKGGFIAEQRTVRELPLGKIGERTVGRGQAGLEGAYNEYLQGKNGRRLKQKIAKGQWKPIGDANELEPQDGLDVYSTIDINMQDVAHHALLRQLEKYEAHHGTVVVMETKTGEIKAMANLARTSLGTYYEKRNYAVWEAQEPGSTYKLMTLVAALEDKVVDTSDVFDTDGGKVLYYDRAVRDSRFGGYGKISVARAFEVSSNTVFSKFITQGYQHNPEKLVNRLSYMGLNDRIGLDIKGEGKPHIPNPDDANWYGTTLPWMSFGYGVTITPLQTLSFYNAIANDGLMVKPRLIKQVKDKDRLVAHYQQPEVRNTICSKETAAKVKKLMENTVKKGTATNIYSKEFSMAGKTGTCLTNYGSNQKEKEYIASFVGYFPTEQPKYSCIVVITKPNRKLGYYGSTVAAPVFKEIAHAIHTDTPITKEFESLEVENKKVKQEFEQYYTTAQKFKTKVPKVIGMPAMDAVALLENLGLRVVLKGTGEVKKQSLEAYTDVKPNQTIYLLTS